jgi:pilus assembly protein CpaE
MNIAATIAAPTAEYAAAPLAAKGYAHPKVHVFCEEDGTTGHTVLTLHHRRLGAGEIRVFKGGLLAAKSAYERVPSPELIVIETHLKHEKMLASLDDLATVCEANTRLIIIGQINDVHLYRSLIRRDISDYLIAPLAPGQLAASIRAALQTNNTGLAGRSIVVIGAKGGCGASTICHNTGWALAEMARCDTVIADFNLAFGTLGLNFNQDSGHGLSSALAAGQKLDTSMMEKLVAKCSDHLSLLTASYALNAEPDIDRASALQIASLLRQTSQAALLDLPGGWHDWSQALIEQADDCVVVAEPDLANLRNAKNLIDAIRATRDADRSPFLVMNKVGMPRRPEITVKDFAGAVDLSPSLVIGFDARAFYTAANNGLMIGELTPKAKPAAQFLRLARQLGGMPPPKPAEKSARSFIKPFIEKISRKLAL